MGKYDTGVMELQYETDEELEILKAIYPNEECEQDLPCPPPPIGC